MDSTIIAEQALQMQTKEDLLRLLNKIKRVELEEIGLQDQFYPLTINHLNYYCNPNHTFHRYHEFKIKKKTPGKFRTITAPKNKSFILLLSAVNEMLKALYTPSSYAMGFTKGRSVVMNADIHKGQNYVFNIDLQDFFPSIEQARIWKRLQMEPFKFTKEIASLIAGLCSMRVKREQNDETKTHENDKRFKYVLPQGAPTSPIITNMICDKLDGLLGGLAKRFGLRYSRYADDITFSSKHYVYQKEGKFRKELERIITGQGFSINNEKTRLQKRGSRQEVTGIIISNKLNVTQKYVRDIRNILYIWDRYGYSVAYSKFLPKYKEEKGHVKKGNPDLINVIDGKLMYLKMVKGEEDSVYYRFHEKFKKLVDQVRDPQKTTKQHVTYVETMPLLDFEKKNNTEVVITWSKPSNRIEQNKENPEELVDITIPPHRFATFSFAGIRYVASVNKSIKKEEEKAKEQLAISLCRDAKDKQFWLIHRRDKVTVPPPAPVDIDELNNDLDSLINTIYKMDEYLKTMINKIVQLSEQNPEFDIKLRKALGTRASTNSAISSDKRIEHIEKYLGLDYYVDYQKSIIDYSFIKEPEVRAQLISDNREMMRFRYGTRYHAISFDEFCRYAHLQAEMLLNFFYDKVNNNLKDIIDHIKKYNPNAYLKDKIKSLGDIAYNSKLWAFKAEFGLEYAFNTLDYLRRVRNESSHRSPENEEKSIKDYKKQLINIGMPLKPDGEVDFYKLEEGSLKMNVYKNMVQNSDWYKDLKYLVWLHKEPFDDVIKSIEELKLKIKENILI